MPKTTLYARLWAAFSAGIFGYALSGAIGVPFWRDYPIGDGFDLTITAALAAWFIVSACASPTYVLKVEVAQGRAGT